MFDGVTSVGVPVIAPVVGSSTRPAGRPHLPLLEVDTTELVTLAPDEEVKLLVKLVVMSSWTQSSRATLKVVAATPVAISSWLAARPRDRMTR